MTEYVMYIATIKLPPGKLAAQVGHAVLGLYRFLLTEYSDRYNDVRKIWLNDDSRGDGGTQAKVVLKLESYVDFESIVAYCDGKDIPKYVVVDAGRTVVDPGTLTAIAWGPVPKDEDGPWKSMRLY